MALNTWYLTSAGSISNTSRPFQAIIAWKIISQNTVNNSSTVALRSIIRTTSAQDVWNGTCSNWQMTVDGSQQTVASFNSNSQAGWTYTSSSFPEVVNGSYVRAHLISTERTFTISHDANGSKIAIVSHAYSLNSGGFGPGNVSFNTSITLDTINRVSLLNSVNNNIVLDTNLNRITYNRTVYVSTFYHKIELYQGSTIRQTWNLGQLAAGTTSANLTLDTNAINNIYAALPNTDSTSSLNFKFYTYSNSAMTSQIGVVQEVSGISGSIPASVVPPTPSSLTYTRNNTYTSGGTVYNIQGRTTLTFAANYGEWPQNGSNFSTYEVLLEGLTYGPGNSTSKTLDLNGNVPIKLRVKDSRGRWSSYFNTTVPVQRYFLPRDLGFDVTRDSSTPSRMTIKYNFEVAGVPGNAWAYQIDARPTLGGSYFLVKTKTSITAGNNTLNTTETLTYNFNEATTYTIRVSLYDTVTGINTVAATHFDTLGTTITPLSIAKHGIGVGKVWEEGALDVYGDAKIAGTVTATGAMYTVTPPEASNNQQVATTAFVRTEIDKVGATVTTHNHDDRYYLKGSVDTLLNAKIDNTEKGSAGGVATLDASGHVPSSQLPSYVDDVLEYDNLAAFPSTGENGKIYVTKDTNKTYRWAGAGYVEISASLALGETSSTAYRGDRGKAAYDHSISAHAPSNANFYEHPVQAAIDANAIDNGVNVIDRVVVNTLGHVTSVATRNLSEATTGAAGVMSSGDKVKLNGIQAGAQVNQTISSGNGMAGWSPTNGDLTVSLGTPGTLTTATGNNTTATSHTHAVVFPVTSVNSKTGAVVLNNTDVGAAASVHNHSEYVLLGDTLQNTNPFGGRKLYVNTLDNALAAADKKYFVTVTIHKKIFNSDTYPKAINTGNILLPQWEDSPIHSSASAVPLFNNHYEGGILVPSDSYAKIRVDFSENRQAYFDGYPYGTYYLSYYYTDTPEKAEVRCYNGFASHTVGYKTSSFTDYIGTNSSGSYIQQCVDNGNYQRREIEFIVYGNPNHNTRITQIEWKLSRPSFAKNTPIFSNYGTNKSYQIFHFGDQVNNNISINPSGSISALSFQGPLDGNATTATTLQNARTLTIGNSGKNFNGSANLSWTLAEIGAQPTLVSGTNIKTVNNNSLLGSGNVSVGTVTSVGLSVPTGFSVSGTPVSTTGTLALGFASGYSLPTTAKQTAWDTHMTSTGADHTWINQDVRTTASPSFVTVSGNSFVSGFAGSGWRLDQGLTVSGKSHAEVDNLTIRDSLRVYELLINQIRGTNGSMFVSSTGKVKTVNIGTSTLTFDSENGLGHGFAVGDIIRMQRWNSVSSQIAVSDLRVLTVPDQSSLTYVKISGSDPSPGFEYIRLGNTTDATRQGSIHMTADSSNGPFIDIVNEITSHSEWNTPGKIKARFGNLSGISGASGYGLWSDNVFLTGTITANAGRIGGWDISGNNIVATTNGEIRTSNTTTRLQLDSTGLKGYNSGTQRVEILNDGSGWLGTSNKISWTNAGVLKVGNWTVESDSIRTGNYNTLNTMYFGTSGLSLSNTFSVTPAGALTATNATITGAITATSGSFSGSITSSSGTIGGWTIGSGGISSGSTNATSKGILSGDTIAFYSGHLTPGSAPFRVTQAGALTATNATITGSVTSTSGSIGGWTLASNRISSTGGINLEHSATAASNKIYIGIGTYNNADTSFYVDGSGRMSLKDKFTWDGSNLNISANSLKIGASDVATTTQLGNKEDSVFKQNTAPAHAVGRLWLDTSVTPNILKRSTGSAWVNASPTTAAQVGAFSATEGSALTTRVTNAETSITQQSEAIALRATKTEVTQAIDNIQVGGRNLLLSSNDISKYWVASSSIMTQEGNVIRGVANGTTNPSWPRIWNTSTKDIIFDTSSKYTISFKIRGSSGRNTSYGVMDPGGRDAVFGATVTVTTEWQQVVYTFTPLRSGSELYQLNLQFYTGGTTGDTTNWIELQDLKLEKGNIATDWTPAPEDVDGKIDTIETRVSAAELKITPTAITSTVRSSTEYVADQNAKENTVFKQNTAPAHAVGRLWLNTSEMPNILYRSDGTAWIKASPTEASEVGAFRQTDASALLTRMSTAETAINQTSQAIQLAATKQEVSTLKTNVEKFANDKATEAETAAKGYADGIVSSVSSRVDEAMLAIEPDKIISTVLDSESFGSEKTDILSSVEQTAGTLVLDLEKTIRDEYGQTINNVNSTFKFTGDGLNISRAADGVPNPMNLNLSSESIQFRRGTTAVAEITPSEMTIGSAKIATSIQVGVHQILKHNSNVTIITWVGE